MDIFILRVEREKQNREEGKKLPGEGKRGMGLLFTGLPSIFPNMECACGLLKACMAVH